MKIPKHCRWCGWWTTHISQCCALHRDVERIWREDVQLHWKETHS